MKLHFWPVGVNTVTCEATNSAGKTGSASFTITITESSADTASCEVVTCLGGSYVRGGGLDAWNGITVTAYSDSTSTTGRTLEMIYLLEFNLAP